MAVIAHNDKNISDDDILIRRINPSEHLVPDESTGGLRVSTKAISSSSISPYGMSVDALKLMKMDGVNVIEFVTCPKYTASVQFSAGIARTSGLWVGYDPLKKDGENPENPYHAEVWNQPDPMKDFTKRQKKAILNSCEWLVPIDNANIPRTNS